MWAVVKKGNGHFGSAWNSFVGVPVTGFCCAGVLKHCTHFSRKQKIESMKSVANNRERCKIVVFNLNPRFVVIRVILHEKVDQFRTAHKFFL
jgi:hypothetical protein